MLLVLGLPAASTADVAIFADDFESGDTSAWDVTALCGGTLATRCLIAGACYAVGQGNPVNQCQVCDPAVDYTAWTNRPDGTMCSDGSGFLCSNGVCNGTCFAAGTPIVTAEGLVPIEEIVPGVRVPSYSTLDGTVTYSRVVGVERRPASSLLRLELEGDDELVVTAEHPFAVAGEGWVPARALEASDVLLQLRGTSAQVASVEPLGAASAAGGVVYNLRVEDTGTYFAGRSQVLVNSCSAPLDVVAAPSPIERETRVQLGELGGGFPLLVYNAIAASFSLVRDQATYTVTELDCLPVGRWALRAGVADDHLFVIDNERREVVVVPLGALRDVASGDGECRAGEDLATLRVPLPSRDVANDAVLADDGLYLSYFAKRRIDVFHWSAVGAGGGPTLRSSRPIDLPGPARPGPSALARWRGELWVADVNWQCDDGDCPRRFGSPRLFHVSLSDPDARVGELRPAAINASGLYVHAADDALYVLAAGDGGGLQADDTRGASGSRALRPRPSPRRTVARRSFAI